MIVMAARRFVPFVVATLLAACAPSPEPPPAAPAVPEPAPAAPASPPPEVKRMPVPRTPLEAYKFEIARRILETNAPDTFEGTPPPMLRAVVVLEFTVDREGRMTRLKTLRSRHPDMERVALASLRKAAPLPRPPLDIMRGASLHLTETWLFRDDGRFQIRSLAEPQADTI